MSEIEDQMIDLQTQLAYQEDTIQALNDMVVLQQQDIMLLKQQMAQLLEDLRGTLEEGQSNAGSVFDDRPPHY
ncbi:MAG: SlyX family protein [Pseudomonadales bacterium]|nr:SlyX family protein [Pseudomonadales bacterium]